MTCPFGLVQTDFFYVTTWNQVLNSQVHATEYNIIQRIVHQAMAENESDC